MAEVIVSMLPVGQGAMNLIEIYDNGGQLVNLSLVDCGAEYSKRANPATLKRNEKACVQYVMQRMELRYNRGDKLMLDYVFITHLDGDHWSLYSALFEMIFSQNLIINLNTNERICFSIIDDFFDYVEFFESEKEKYCGARGSKETFLFSEYLGILDFEVIYMENSKTETLNVEFPDLEFYMESELINSQELNILVEIGNYEIAVKAISDNNIACASIKESGEDIKEETFGIQNYGNVLEAIMCCLKKIINVNELEEFQKYFEYIYVQAQSIVFPNEDYIMNALRTKEDARVGIINGFIYGGSIKHASPSAKEFLRKMNVVARKCLEGVENSTYDLYRDSNEDKSFFMKIVARLSADMLKNDSRFKQSYLNIVRNATSMICVLQCNECPVVLFSGDATMHTIQYMWKFTGQKMSEIQNAVWTAPHHGSFRTMNGIEFSAFMLNYAFPKAMIISAGFNSRHGHPHGSFINWTKVYFEGMRKQVNEHYICYNKFDYERKNAYWVMEKVSIPVYTSVCFDGIMIYKNIQLLFMQNGSFVIQKNQPPAIYTPAIPRYENISDMENYNLKGIATFPAKKSFVNR